MAELRSLSQTCRRLREITLPLVWTQVEVTTVKQLGQLRETLRAQPHIALLIRSFRFFWDMGGDGDPVTLAIFEEQEPLDLAFCDRLGLWDRIWKAGLANEEMVSFFDHAGLSFDDWYSSPPGDHDFDALQAADTNYDWLVGKRGRGPDGYGEDELIKNAEELTHCLIGVIGSCASLETFGWETVVVPMLTGVFDVLARLTTLQDLRVRASSARTNWTGCECLVLMAR